MRRLYKTVGIPPAVGATLRAVGSASMGEEHHGFRFLTHAEFSALPVKEMAMYLVRAQQEAAKVQQALRQQTEILAKLSR
jgi:hypothetical protein